MSVVSMVLATVVVAQSPGQSVTTFLTKAGYKSVSSAPGEVMEFYREAPDLSADRGSQQGASADVTQGPARVPMIKAWAQVFLSKKPVASPPWKPLSNPYYVESVYLGESGGWHAYLKAPLFDTIALLKKGEFRKGADWGPLAVRGVTIEDTGTCTANSCIHFFKDTGDKYVPALVKALEKDPKACWHVVSAIGETRGPRSTKELIRLYRSGGGEISNCSASALIRHPLRPAAKAVYFDMVSKGMYVSELSQEFVSQDWKDALPALRKVIDKPQYPWNLVRAIEAERELSGKPIDKEVKAAFYLAMRLNPKGVEQSLQLLPNYRDEQVVAAYAWALLKQITKADTTDLNKAGEKILSGLSPEAVDWLRKRFPS